MGQWLVDDFSLVLKSQQKKTCCVKSQGTEQFLIITQEFISWVAGSNNLNTLRNTLQGMEAQLNFRFLSIPQYQLYTQKCFCFFAVKR